MDPGLADNLKGGFRRRRWRRPGKREEHGDDRRGNGLGDVLPPQSRASRKCR
jgi:hypothetical protein